MILVFLIVFFSGAYAFAQSSTCEQDLKLVAIQAQEYYADRDAKQKEKIMLRSQLNDAQVQIRALKAELTEAKKAAPKEDAAK